MTDEMCMGHYEDAFGNCYEDNAHNAMYDLTYSFGPVSMMETFCSPPITDDCFGIGINDFGI